MTIRSLAVLAASLILIGSAPVQAGAGPAKDPDVELLARHLTGRFDTRAQASADPRFEVVEAEIEPLFEGREVGKPGPWLLFSMRTESYPAWLQALYRLHKDDQGRVIIESYRIKTADGSRVSRAQAEASGPEIGTYLKGCDLWLLNGPDQVFRGQHFQRTCENKFRGSDYVWALKDYWADGFRMFERGFSWDDEVVWGPPSAYEFRRTPRQQANK